MFHKPKELLFALHWSSVLDGHKEKKKQCVCSEKFCGRCAILTHLSQTESFQIVLPTFHEQVTVPSALPV